MTRSMHVLSVRRLLSELGTLQSELESAGISLEVRGCREAADVALVTAARLDELRRNCADGACDPTDARNASSDAVGPNFIQP